MVELVKDLHLRKPSAHLLFLPFSLSLSRDTSAVQGAQVSVNANQGTHNGAVLGYQRFQVFSLHFLLQSFPSQMNPLSHLEFILTTCLGSLIARSPLQQTMLRILFSHSVAAILMSQQADEHTEAAAQCLGALTSFSWHNGAPQRKRSPQGMRNITGQDGDLTA